MSFGDMIGIGTRIHRVGPNETLYDIAEHYYGDWKKWRIIFNHNTEHILNSDPNAVYPGTELVIPHLEPTLAKHMVEWVVGL